MRYEQPLIKKKFNPEMSEMDGLVEYLLNGIRKKSKSYFHNYYG